MKALHAGVALALVAAGCTDSADRAQRAEGEDSAKSAALVDSADAAGLRQRAEAAAGREAGGIAVGETLAPFTISAASLTGKEPFPWGTDSWELQVVAAHAEEQTPRATMQFLSRSGRMLVNLPQGNGYHYYVECDVRMSAERMALRWDAMMNQTGPVNGTATYDPATKRYYFVTPAAGTTANNRVFFTIDAQLSQNPPDSHWLLHRCDVLPFKAG